MDGVRSLHGSAPVFSHIGCILRKETSMKGIPWRVSAFAILLALAGAAAAAAQPAGALTLQATGTFAKGGSFEGTVTIIKFEARGNQIVAIGFVTGVLSRGGHALGTAFAGEVAWPVKISPGGVSPAVARPPAAAQRGRIAPVAWVSGARPGSGMVPARADICPVLQLALGPVDVNLLGLQVALGAVSLDISGAVGTPLGDLVCAVLALLGNVADLVNVLNSLLGLLTGLLGGLTGGLGGGLAAAVIPGF
jgi:hypothetical protein